MAIDSTMGEDIDCAKRTRISSRRTIALTASNRRIDSASAVADLTARIPCMLSLETRNKSACARSEPRTPLRMRFPNFRNGIASIGTATSATRVIRQSNHTAARNAAPPLVICATVLPVSATNPRCNSELSRTVRLTRSEAPRCNTVPSGRFTACLKISWRISVTVRTHRVNAKYW